MIIYFADRKMNIIESASTKLPEGLYIKDDLKVEEIDAGVATLEFYLPFTDDNRLKAEEMTAAGNYVLRYEDGETEYYTIIETEVDSFDRTIYVYAEDAGLDLLNEVVGPYSAEEAHPAAFYIEKFAYDSGFEIGINEISNLSRKLSWEGEQTATERILSVATQFDNAEISFSSDVKGLSITHKYINIFKQRGQDAGIELRSDRDINSITTKTSVANLATALLATGGTPEGSETPINLVGYEYDDGDFYVKNGYLISRSSLEKWSRYLSESGDGEGNIVQTFSYDTVSQEELFNRTLSKLKKIRNPEVNYEVDIAILPKGTKIGDTINIVDGKGKLYLSARLLKLETSISNDTRKATLGDYILRSSGISELLEELAKKFQDIAQGREFYTWFAYADDAFGKGISLDPDGKDYIGTAANKLTPKVDISDPSVFTWAKIKGDPGIPGADGENGTDGRTSYFHVKYSAVAKPTQPEQISDIPNIYIGTYVDFNVDDSPDPLRYTWARLQGANGEQGIPGVNGEDGKTSYLHLKYSNDGGLTFTSNNGEDPGSWLGQYVDFEQMDSSDPSDYKWSKIQGDEGTAGKPGEDGKTTYFHVKYSHNENGNPMTETPDLYIGTYVDFNQFDSDDYRDYNWSRFQGYDGEQGIPGINGEDGKTSYLHIKYSNDGGKTFTENNGETPGDWIGQYVDFVQQDSGSPSAYTWTKIKGDPGEDGKPGEDGIIVSPYPPENPKENQLWQTESGAPIKRWDGEKWVLYYISVENLDVENLSAISGDVGELTAGIIKGKTEENQLVINLNKGEITSDDLKNLFSLIINSGKVSVKGKDIGTNVAETGMRSDRGFYCEWPNREEIFSMRPYRGEEPDVQINGKIPLYGSLKNIFIPYSSYGFSSAWQIYAWDVFKQNQCIYFSAELYTSGILVSDHVYTVNSGNSMPESIKPVTVTILSAYATNGSYGSARACHSRIDPSGDIYLSVPDGNLKYIFITGVYRTDNYI